jgi:DNA replication ATP-dependent helicase Dna2
VFSILEDGSDEPAFDVAIIDEASQLTEPLVLAAVNLARRFVLVGDDQQLPPVVTADDALSSNVESPGGVLSESGIKGLDHSLFARLRPHVPHVMLTTQYRMSQSVQEFPNNAFYDGKLCAWPGVRDRVMPSRTDSEDSSEQSVELDPSRGFVWVETEPADTPRLNENEVAHIAKTIRELLPMLDHPDPASQIGVVSPFRAQCHAIRSALRAVEDGGRIEVDTVERFQGREKEVMLVSLVTSEWSDFVMSPARLNVTLTRARSKVIVFGTSALKARLFESFGIAPPT